MLADRAWNGTTTPDRVSDFHTRMDRVGNPPDYEGFAARARVDDGEPSHHYTFEAADYPSSHHYASSTGNTILAQDAVGGLHGSSYIRKQPARGRLRRGRGLVVRVRPRHGRRRHRRASASRRPGACRCG